DSVFFAPLGHRRWFRRRGIAVKELDWWQKTEYRGLNLHCVPAQHFSGRGLHDRDRCLWAGWVLESEAGRLYFAGDTGYSPGFREIGAAFGPIRVALIPIGAYRP